MSDIRKEFIFEHISYHEVSIVCILEIAHRPAPDSEVFFLSTLSTTYHLANTTYQKKVILGLTSKFTPILRLPFLSTFSEQFSILEVKG